MYVCPPSSLPRLGLRLELPHRLGAPVAVGPAHAAGDLEEGVEVVLDPVGAAGPELARVVEDGRRLVVAVVGAEAKESDISKSQAHLRVFILHTGTRRQRQPPRTHQQAAGWFSASTNGCWQPLLTHVAVPSALRVQAGPCVTVAAADLAALAASGFAWLYSSMDRSGGGAPGAPLASAWRGWGVVGYVYEIGKRASVAPHSMSEDAYPGGGRDGGAGSEDLLGVDRAVAPHGAALDLFEDSEGGKR